MSESNLAEDLRTALKPFLDANPEAGLAARGEGFVINRPWGDSTVVIEASTGDTELIDALNAVHLPPRFTALWHKDSRDLEFIFTAVPVEPHLYSRRFEFRFEGGTRLCEFSDSSPRLLTIAKASRPVEPPTETDHRNLSSYYLFSHYRTEHPESEEARQWRPVSFWIRRVDLSEEQLLDLARHVNFFMRYFDPRSPTILIHQPPEPATPRYADPLKTPQSFPAAIAAGRLDPFLLRLWESSREAVDPFRRFLYQYQIIEYCAFYHLQDEVLREIRRALATPDLPSRVEEVARDVFEALAEDRMEEARKIQIIIERHVDPAKLWPVIHPNSEYFSGPIEFDGGLRLQPLIKQEWSLEDFKTAWCPKFADSLRMIRNGLVHAREKRMSGIIAPTPTNHVLLQPWLSPLMVTAMELMVYGRS